MKTTVGVTVAAVMLLAGCTSSDSGNDAADTPSKTSAAASAVDCTDPDLSQAQWIDNCRPDATGGDDAPATSPSYDHPADLMDKVSVKVPYLVCDEDVPQRDFYGALGLSCTGRNGETVTFDIYKTNAELIDGTDAKAEINTGSQYYAGENWTISAEEDRTLADLQRVLDPKNAPKVAPLTTSQAKREYQRMVKPVNEDIQEIGWLDEYSELSEYQSTCRTVKSATETFVAELNFAAWPDDVATEAKALAKDTKKSVQHYETCASATSEDSAVTALNSVSSDRAAANNLRSALGLDAAPTD